MAERIERTERLLNLVMCLMASPAPISRAEIQRQIPGYSDAASSSAFERMFERDKDELRSMGIPVETVVDALGEVQGYHIPRDTYGLQELDLTIAERAAIAVAAQVWGQAVVAPVAGTALRKLETLGEDLHAWAPADLQGSVQLTAREASLLPLMAAIRQDRTVTFDYRTPTDTEPHVRTVCPWGVRSSSGRWFLVGYDCDRDDVRTFRLSRMSGTVTVTARTREHPPPADFDIATVDTTARHDDGPVRARLRVTPGRAASLRRLAVRGEPGTSASGSWNAEEVIVEGASLDDLAALVCAAGPDVAVLEPPALADAVRNALRQIYRSHRTARPGAVAP